MKSIVWALAQFSSPLAALAAALAVRSMNWA